MSQTSAQILNLLFADPDLQLAIKDRIEDLCIDFLESPEFRERVQDRLKEIEGETNQVETELDLIPSREAAKLLNYNKNYLLEHAQKLGLKKVYVGRGVSFYRAEVKKLIKAATR